MKISKTLLSFAVAAALLAGCKNKNEETPVALSTTETPTAETGASDVDAASATTGEMSASAPAATPAAAVLDISKIPVSDKVLPAWPYIALPVGYEFDNANDIAKNSKDLARVPVWTGGQLLWVEGKTFSDQIDSIEGKTFSKFEVRKNLQQAIENLGAVRVSERSFDEPTYKANEKAIDDFRQEFSRIRDAYWYDKDADTYLIRRADKAIWVVAQFSDNNAGLMLVEGPLPEPNKQ